jgi:hypothetical protein
LSPRGGKGLSIAVDVADASDIESAAEQIEQSLGNIEQMKMSGRYLAGGQFRDPSAGSIYRKIVCPRARHAHLADGRTPSWFPALARRDRAA